MSHPGDEELVKKKREVASYMPAGDFGVGGSDAVDHRRLPANRVTLFRFLAFRLDVRWIRGGVAAT
jgi:hypothetical protein